MPERKKARDLLLIIFLVCVVAIAGLFFLEKKASTEILASTVLYKGNKNIIKFEQNLEPGVLDGKDALVIKYNLGGVCVLSGPASELALTTHEGKKYNVSLADYGENCAFGEQTVKIPLADFVIYHSVENIHSLGIQFWYPTEYKIEIKKITAHEDTLFGFSTQETRDLLMAKLLLRRPAKKSRPTKRSSASARLPTTRILRPSAIPVTPRVLPPPASPLPTPSLTQSPVNPAPLPPPAPIPSPLSPPPPTSIALTPPTSSPTGQSGNAQDQIDTAPPPPLTPATPPTTPTPPAQPPPPPAPTAPSGPAGGPTPPTPPAPLAQPPPSPLPPPPPPPPSQAVTNWQIKSVSSMKETKDKICNQDSQEFINAWVVKATELGVNYIAVETPYDNPKCASSIGYTKIWSDTIHAKGLNIWHRHMPLAFE